MYASEIDNEIADYNKLNYSTIKEEMKKGISEQILLSISNKTPVISLEHHKDSNSQILNYIYNSIGLKYEKVKSKDTVEVTTKKTDLIKERLNKFVHQTNQHHEKAKYERGNLNNGEIHTSNYTEERFNLARRKEIKAVGKTNFITTSKSIMWGGTVEIRAPFAWKPFVEYHVNVPPLYRMENGNTKPLLREAFKDEISDELVF